MGYTLSYQSNKKIILITVEGKLSFSIAKQYSIEAGKLAHTSKCNKFLIDHSKTTLQDGIYKIHTDGEELEQFGFKKTDRIAIVISRDKDDRHFLEKAYLQLGWNKLQYFDTVEDAVAWLVQEEEDYVE
jgi:hypothetical protein